MTGKIDPEVRATLAQVIMLENRASVALSREADRLRERNPSVSATLESIVASLDAAASEARDAWGDHRNVGRK